VDVTDLAIGIVSGAGVTIVIVVALLVLSLKLSTAKDDNRDLAVRNAKLEAQGTIDAASIKKLTEDLAREQGVSNGIEDIATKPVPVDGAFDRLLSEAARVPGAAAGAEGGGSQGAVPAAEAPLADRPDSALERP
jgi:hypothetical protein